MRSSALVLLAWAACNPVDDPVATPVAVAPAPPPKIERAPAGVPHGGLITHLAITEEGDAVASVDTVGGLRLWPALDGTLEPVPFSVNGAEALAITHAGDEFLVGVLDQAGAVQLLRFSRLGVLRGRTQVPGETAVTQLVAVERAILVARDDGSLERYDAAGALRGRIALAPGEHLGGLAARHGMAAVLIGSRKTEERPADAPLEEEGARPARRAKILVATETASALRWIELGSELAWGRSIALPEKLDDRVLALSPSLKRIAVIAQTSALQVYDVTKQPVLVDGPKVWAQVGSTVGFVDDDHAVWINGSTRWWTAARAPTAVPKQDPWHVDSGLGEESVNSDGGAVGGDRVVAGLGPDLVIQTLHDTRYLGWRDVAAGNVLVSGPHVGLETGNRHIVWLDRGLGRESEVDLEDLGYAGNPTAAWWLDPNHAVIRKGGNQATVELVDFRHKDVHVALGTYAYMRQVELLPALHELALIDEGVVHRFSFDLERDQVTELPALDAPVSLSYIRLLDPAKADGVIAIAVGYDDVGQRATFYRDGEVLPGKRLKGKKAKPLAGAVVGIGPDATLYVREGTTTSMWKDGKKIRTWPDGAVAATVTPDARGERFVGIHGSAVTMYDGQGNVAWTQNVWGAQTASFTSDGGQIVMRTTGGVLALDATTGARTAAACGFSFGLMTKTPPANALNVQPVCEDLGS
ncbi:MAG: hypothetical protein ABI678_02820 [Kofleriaceae bacterium]